MFGLAFRFGLENSDHYRKIRNRNHARSESCCNLKLDSKRKKFIYVEQTLKISVIGAGYVGLVTGGCLAGVGHEVVCTDNDIEKLKTLESGRLPIYEPGLEELVRRNRNEERLSFTTDLPSAVRASEIVFVAVGTPQGEDGSADLQHVLGVAPMGALRVADVGDVPMRSRYSLADCHADIEACYRRIAATKVVPLSVGSAKISTAPLELPGRSSGDFCQRSTRYPCSWGRRNAALAPAH